MLPPLFAIHTGRPTTYRYDFAGGDPDMVPDYTTGRVAIFQSRMCHDGRGGGTGSYDPWALRDVPYNTYRISPYRIHTGVSDSGEGRMTAFVMEGRFGSPLTADGPVQLYSEERGPPSVSAAGGGYYDEYYGGYRDRDHDRLCIYRGHWRYSGYTVFSMYCATPIPILVFTDSSSIEWPNPHYNRIAVAEGDRTIIRVWAQRWDPVTWENEIEEAYAAREARAAVRHRAHHTHAASGGGAAAPPPPPPPIRQAPPKFVADLIIADAIAKGVKCPITMEPLTADKTTVTPCYHLFDADALNAWAAEAANTTTLCPQCRNHL